MPDKDNTTKPELLLCPFCGRAPDMWPSYHVTAGTGTVYISCCAEMNEGFVQDEYKPKKDDSEKAANKKIIHQWNRRA